MAEKPLKRKNKIQPPCPTARDRTTSYKNTTHKKWHESIIDRTYKLCLLGLDDRGLRLAFGVSECTWNEWKNQYPDLKASIEKGREMADSEVADGLYRKATGYTYESEELFLYKGEVMRVPITKHVQPDSKAASFWLKNRTRHLPNPWSDRLEITGKNGGAITINTLPQLSLSDLTDDELQMLKKLSLVIHQTEPPTE